MSDSQKVTEPSSTAEEVVAAAEDEVVAETVAAAPVIPATTTTVGDETDAELRLRRSSSLSSDGSLKTFRFLRLGPVYHGEQDGDWSEEIAVVE